jgi:MarR family transcriptional regulator for hemolysin
MTLVRILDRMEADGFIERRADPADRRARTLFVTSKATPTLEQIWAIGAQTRNEMFIGMSTEERNTLMTLMERVHENLLSLKPVAGSAPPAPQNRKAASK